MSTATAVKDEDHATRFRQGSAQIDHRAHRAAGGGEEDDLGRHPRRLCREQGQWLRREGAAHHRASTQAGSQRAGRNRRRSWRPTCRRWGCCRASCRSDGGWRWKAAILIASNRVGSRSRAIVAPELPIARLDLSRVDRDISGRRIRDFGRKIRPQLLQMGGHRRIFLRDRKIAVVIVGDPVVETDGFQDGSGGAR